MTGLPFSEAVSGCCRRYATAKATTKRGRMRPHFVNGPAAVIVDRSTLQLAPSFEIGSETGEFNILNHREREKYSSEVRKC